MGLLNSANQNRLAIGQREAGKAVQGAITPDGTVDNKLLMQGIQSNPLVAPAAQEAVQGAQAIQSNKIAIDQAQLNKVKDQINFTRQTLGSLAADPDLNQTKVIEATGKLIAQGVISPQQAATEIASMPKDPAELKKWTMGHLINSMQAAEQFHSIYGTPQLIAGKGPNGEDIQTPIAVPSVPGMAPRVQGAEGGEATGAPASPVNPQTGAITTSLPAGQEENLQKSAQAYQVLRQDLERIPQRLFTLNKALTALKSAPTGGGSETRNTIMNYVQSLAGEGVIPGVDAEQIKNFDEANKYLIQYASQQADSMGPGTNEGLATALSGNANTHISNLAAQDVVKANMALERLRQAQAITFDMTKQPDNQFSDFSLRWGKNVDPVAFGIDVMEPKARKKYFDGLTTEGKKRFRESVKIGIATGVLDRSAIGG